jgi:hypothetical protein
MKTLIALLTAASLLGAVPAKAADVDLLEGLAIAAVYSAVCQPNWSAAVYEKLTNYTISTGTPMSDRKGYG